MATNLFCDHSDLRNEADVEQNFARRLIEYLGYSDKSIRPKASLESLTPGQVGSAGLTKPDFAMKADGHIRWVLEAKAPTEVLDHHLGQAQGYCRAINDSYSWPKPVRWCVLTNGLETRVYRIDSPQPEITLTFQACSPENSDFKWLVDTLRPDAFTWNGASIDDSDSIHFVKPSLAEVNLVFANCHQYIHNTDALSQAAGFVEFVKLITLKLLSDKTVRENFPGVWIEREFDYPADKVTFSRHWLNAQEATTANPVDSILFRDFMEDVEKQIALKVRKRFFDKGERIRLKPETIRGVVERLEGLYLFGIDADLNGRLFENFLSATMRGKDLGQFFTPRTLVKLGVGLGDLKPSDHVLDACCGTGGFLIDALADMWAKVNSNASLTPEIKASQRESIANNQIYGIDFASDPNLAKIARLNMYLHGHGGSRIYNVDALDIAGEADTTIESPEEIAERHEIQELGLQGMFDVVLTNPPFSKKYSQSSAGDALVLNQYEIAVGKSNVRAKLMFFEMYHHYLKPGGRLVSVIDDGFLNGASYHQFRQMLRKLYFIKAVISLPGDAFQRSEARVKTSFIVLEKKPTDGTGIGSQASIFMYACRTVGLDDPKRKRWMPGDDELREETRSEVDTVIEAYRDFLAGSGKPQHIVPPEFCQDRLDVKHCLIERNWQGLQSPTKLSDVVTPKVIEGNDVVDCKTHEEPVHALTVTYDGAAQSGNTILPRTETQYPQLFRVRTGDIVISNIAATYGSVAIVPSELDGFVVSKEYTVLAPRSGYNPRVIQSIMRSPEIRAAMLVGTTGANRTRIRWNDIKDIAFPYPDLAEADRFTVSLEEAEAALRKAESARSEALERLNTNMSLDSEYARHILDAFKPPK